MLTKVVAVLVALLVAGTGLAEADVLAWEPSVNAVGLPDPDVELIAGEAVVTDVELSVDEGAVADVELTAGEAAVTDVELSVHEGAVPDVELSVDEGAVTDVELSVHESAVPDVELSVDEGAVTDVELSVDEGTVADVELFVNGAVADVELFVGAVADVELSVEDAVTDVELFVGKDAAALSVREDDAPSVADAAEVLSEEKVVAGVLSVDGEARLSVDPVSGADEEPLGPEFEGLAPLPLLVPPALLLNETWQILSSRTRGSPFGPFTGVRWISQSSWTVPRFLHTRATFSLR